MKNKEYEPPKVVRCPVMLHCDTVAVIEVYKRPSEILEDFGYFWEATGNDHSNYEQEASNFIGQIEGHMCIAFMKALRSELDDRIKEHEERVKSLNGGEIN